MSDPIVEIFHQLCQENNFKTALIIGDRPHSDMVLPTLQAGASSGPREIEEPLQSGAGASSGPREIEEPLQSGAGASSGPREIEEPLQSGAGASSGPQEIDAVLIMGERYTQIMEHLTTYWPRLKLLGQIVGSNHNESEVRMAVSNFATRQSINLDIFQIKGSSQRIYRLTKVY